MTTPGAVRPPAVAGRFYPDDRAALLAQIDDELHGAPPPSTDEPFPKALVVPHAGYRYSGGIAAAAYARLCSAPGRAVTRVVLAGPSHRVPLRGMAVPSTAAFRTPLGEVAVDATAREQALRHPAVVVDDEPHGLEHSLEVHLPFLQRVLHDGWSVLPVVVGDTAADEVADLLDDLWGGRETLLLVSTDLSHHHDLATAERLDDRTVHAMVTADPDAITPTDACGARPLRGLLQSCRRRGLRPRLLARGTSADRGGPPDAVVGYASLAVDEGPAPGPPPLGAADRLALAQLPHAALASRAQRDAPAGATPERTTSALRAPGASFVTLRDRDGGLLGCIGSLEAVRPLGADVARNTVRAAFEDPRLPPVRPHEVADVHAKVSVLGARDLLAAATLPEVAEQLHPGRDGLILELGGREATFLPSVWRQIPDPADFCEQLCRKAGATPPHRGGGLRAWRYRVVEIEAPPPGAADGISG